jgi:hypothetical protein
MVLQVELSVAAVYHRATETLTLLDVAIVGLD